MKIIERLEQGTIIDSVSEDRPGGKAPQPAESAAAIPMQRLKSTHEKAVNSVQAIKANPNLRVGLVGPTNCGKSHITDDVLTEHLLQDHYRQVDPAKALSLSAQEKTDPRRHFPALAGEDMKAAITLRPTVFTPTVGAVLVSVKAFSKKELITLLIESIKDNRQELLAELKDIPDDDPMFIDRTLYDDSQSSSASSSASSRNCWDAFKAAALAITKAEEALQIQTASAVRRELTKWCLERSAKQGKCPAENELDFTHSCSCLHVFP